MLKFLGVDDVLYLDVRGGVSGIFIYKNPLSWCLRLACVIIRMLHFLHKHFWYVITSPTPWKYPRLGPTPDQWHQVLWPEDLASVGVKAPGGARVQPGLWFFWPHTSARGGLGSLGCPPVQTGKAVDVSKDESKPDLLGDLLSWCLSCTTMGSSRLKGFPDHLV